MTLGDLRDLRMALRSETPTTWTRCEDRMPEDGQECLIWHVLGDTARHPHAMDIATWLKGEWIFPWDRPKLNNTPQWVRAWMPLPDVPAHRQNGAV